MIETIIRNYLIGSEIEGVWDHVYMEVPEDPPEEYILIEKTGSGEQDKIRSALIAVQSISKNRLITAARISEDVVSAMAVFAEESDEIYSCKLNNDYNFTNPETKEYRYQAVFNLYY